jgi:peptidoglycan/xylan/chitin deacetylase (PgdA/CDA1 family)
LVDGGHGPTGWPSPVTAVASRLAILGWHNVEGSWCFPARGSGAKGLLRQLLALTKVANIVPLAPALRMLTSGHPLPPRAVAITFDDGYRDTLHLAVPVLEKLRLPATFFLVPGLLSGTVTPWWEVIPWAFARSTRSAVDWDGAVLPTSGHAGRRSSGWVAARMKATDQKARDRMVSELVERLRPQGEAPGRTLFLDWDGAREIVRRGFSVGSHSMHHAILAREEVRVQFDDLAASRRQLEAELGVTVELLAYPNGQPGDYDTDTFQAARLTGYSHAITTIEGWNITTTPAYEIRRFVMYPERGLSGFLVVAGRRGLSLAGRVLGERERTVK